MSILGKIKTSLVKPKKSEKAKKAPENKNISSEKALPHMAGRISVPASLISRPYVTEKTSLLQANSNTYVFKVRRHASANEVKKAVARIFGVTVVRVNMANMPKKTIRLGVHEGSVPGFRKAMVTLKDGDKIDTGV